MLTAHSVGPESFVSVTLGLSQLSQCCGFVVWCIGLDFVVFGLRHLLFLVVDQENASHCVVRSVVCRRHALEEKSFSSAMHCFVNDHGNLKPVAEEKHLDGIKTPLLVTHHHTHGKICWNCYKNRE